MFVGGKIKMVTINAFA